MLTGTRISTRHDNRARASSLVDIKPVTPQSPAATARSSMLGRRRESHLGLLGNGLHIRTFLALTWTGGDGSGSRRAVEFPQAFRFALDICLFAAGCALFFFDHALQATALGFVCFLALLAAAVCGTFFGLGLGAQAGGFGVQFPLRAWIGHRWWAGLRGWRGCLESGEGGALEVVWGWCLDCWGC